MSPVSYFRRSDNYADTGGVVTFNDFNLSSDEPLLKQLDELKEDMLQVEFPDQYLLDIGWFPSFNINGSFQIRLVKDSNWQQPIFYEVAKSLLELTEGISKVLSLCPARSSQHHS